MINPSLKALESALEFRFRGRFCSHFAHTSGRTTDKSGDHHSQDNNAAFGLIFESLLQRLDDFVVNSLTTYS